MQMNVTSYIFVFLFKMIMRFSFNLLLHIQKLQI